jgi:hypothetical protein
VKKNSRKLTLNRETLRNLGDGKLSAVAGGGSAAWWTLIGCAKCDPPREPDSEWCF